MERDIQRVVFPHLTIMSSMSGAGARDTGPDTGRPTQGEAVRGGRGGEAKTRESGGERERGKAASVNRRGE